MTLLLIKFSSFEKVTNSLEKHVRSISKNLSDIGFQLASSKTALLHFNNKKISPDRDLIDMEEYVSFGGRVW